MLVGYVLIGGIGAGKTILLVSPAEKEVSVPEPGVLPSLGQDVPP